MSIVLLGGHGQLGTALARCLGEETLPLSRKDGDLTKTSLLIETLESMSPKTVINCAAYNLVDRAEEERQLAYLVNSDAPARLAEWCEARDILFVHFSTDYVFGGDTTRTTPYTEEDPPAPLSVYGESKLQGERKIQQVCSRHFVIRTCGLYGDRRSPGKGNFVETMLKLGQTRSELNVVDDQTCTPTSTEDLAFAVKKLMTTNSYGLYHATNSGETTWCQLAREIFLYTDQSIQIRPITSEEFGAVAKRPNYSVLDHTKLSNTVSFQMPDWKDALHRYLDSQQK